MCICCMYLCACIYYVYICNEPKQTFTMYMIIVILLYHIKAEKYIYF